MKSTRVIPLRAETFALLVRQLRKRLDEGDIFEVDLDVMRVKGDLAVIRRHFGKPLIAKASTLDLLRRAVKSGFDYVRIPEGMELDLEFTTLVKNKGAQILPVTLESGEELR